MLLFNIIGGVPAPLLGISAITIWEFEISGHSLSILLLIVRGCGVLKGCDIVSLLNCMM
jgi:hypothetical protein